MTFINWESLLKIKHAENLISCLPELRPLLALSPIQRCYSMEHMGLYRKLISVVDSDINALILDYLTTEGYPSAAAKFSKEANLRPLQEQESVRARQQIQHSIHLGSIQDAIDALNELEPQVSTSMSLYLYLL